MTLSTAVAELTVEVKRIPTLVKDQIAVWDKQVQDVVGSLGVVLGREVQCETLGEAIALIESANGKRIIGGDLIVTLPAGTFADSSAIDLTDAGGNRSRNRIIFRGAGKGATTLQFTNHERGMIYSSNSKIRLEDMTLDAENRTVKGIQITNGSEMYLTEGTVEIINSRATQAISVTQDSKFFAPSLELNDCSGGVRAESRSYVDFNRVVFNSNDYDAGGSFITTYVNSEVNANLAVVNGKNNLSYGIISGYSSRVYAKEIEINDVYSKGCHVEYNSILVVENGLINADCPYGINSQTGSVVRANDLEIKGAGTPLKLESKSYIYFDRGVVSDVSYIGFNCQEGSHLRCYYVKSSILDGARHFHLDKSTAITKEPILDGGDRIAHMHYNSLFQFYNATDLTNINDGDNDNYIYVTGMSVLQDSGSDVSSNIADGTTADLLGTRL